MSNVVLKKNKIVLSDYNFQKDIENRLFMSKLTVLEVDVLNEIIDGSLKIVIDHMADDLGITTKKLLPILEKLSKSQLFEIKGELILVDKDMRKYYEALIMRFDENFLPDIEYLQSLLNKVPISALPNWYAISRSSDHIFNSIVEKFLYTPKIYERYLQELTFDEPILEKIVQKVFSSVDYKVCAKTLMKELVLSEQQFEEHLLFLEFSLVCCISYTKSDGVWKEVITPFHEWREYCLFLQNSAPHLEEPLEKDDHPNLTEAFNAQLKSILTKPLSSKKESSQILETALELELLHVDKQKITHSGSTENWLKKPLIEQAFTLYRHFLSKMSTTKFTDKDFREVEKSLKRLSSLQWVYLDDFIKSSLSIVGNVQPVTLYNKGKRWKYLIPEYRGDEIEFIRAILTDYLAVVGFLNVTSRNNKKCIRLTQLGKIAFCD